MPPSTLTRRVRSKTGCLCCRLRRKKCPEEKPICTSCKKLRLPCSWPRSEEFAWRLNMGIDGDTPAREAIRCVSMISNKVDETRTADPSAVSLACSSPAASPSPSTISSSSSPFLFPELNLEPLNNLIESPPFPAPLATNNPASDAGSEHSTARLTTKARRNNCASPRPPMICSTLASLDPTSQTVLRYYMDYTSDRLMSQKPGAVNVWKRDVLQLAESDNLIMEAVLAVGGAHLAARMTKNQVILGATIKYVVHSIAGLQLALKKWIDGNSALGVDTLRLMLVTCLLAEYECIGGNLNGNFLLHLRASYPVAKILASEHRNSQTELVGHLLEHTAHLQFLSGIRFPRPGDRGNGDTAIELVKLIQDGRFALLRSYETFGAYFGCAVELYEMIPALHRFYATRELELSTGRDLGCAADFTRLLQEVSSWEPAEGHSEIHYEHTDTWLNALGGYQGPMDRAAREEVEKARRAEESPMIASAFAVQNSLLLFLYSAYLRHKDDHNRLVVATQPIVDESLDILDRVRGTTWENTTWWPAIVIGSYAQNPEQRQRLLKAFVAFSPPMGIVSRGIEVLKEIWTAPDDVFGLEGLSRVVGANETYCFG